MAAVNITMSPSLRSRLVFLLCALAFAVFARAADYQTEVLAQGSPLRGAQGLAFGPDGSLYVGCIAGQTIYRIDIVSGAVENVVAAPLGGADDLAVAADGTIVWTAIGDSAVRIRHPDGRIEDLAQGLVGVNGINFGPDGRLFATQLLPPSKLFEIDLDGVRPPKFVMEVPGSLNGFEIDADYQLYGPLSQNGTVVQIDLRTRQTIVIGEGMVTPISVNLSPDNSVVVLGYSTGKVLRLDPNTGKHELIVQLEGPIDNHAIAENGLIYVSRFADGQIVEIDPITAAVRVVVPGNFTGPGGLSIVTIDGKEQLLVADLTGNRFVDLQSGAVTRVQNFATSLSRLQRAYMGGTSVAITDDKLYSTNAMTNAVHVFDLETGKPEHTFKNVFGPYDIAVLVSGDVIVAEFSMGRLLRFSRSADGKPRKKLLAKGLKGPVGVAVLGTTDVLVTETYTGALSRVSLADGSVTRLIEDLDQPEGLAVTQDGKVVVAEVGAKRLIQFDLQSGTTEILVDDLPIGATLWRTPAPAFLLTDVVIDRNGNLYVTADGTNDVLKISRVD